MTKSTVLAMSFVAMSLAMMSPAQGALIFYDGFDYGVSTNSNLNGLGGWMDDSNVVGFSADGLTYPGLSSTGGAAMKKLPHVGNIGSNGSTQAHQIVPGLADLFKSESNVFYLSYLAGEKPGSPTTTSRRGNLAIFAHDGDGTPHQDGISMGTTNGMSTQVLDIGAGEGNANPGDAVGTKLLVARITMAPGDDALAGITSPDLATLVDSDFDSAITAYGDMSATSENIEWLGLWIGTWGISDDGDNTLVDEIRIGTTLADVIPVPEPASVALLGLGGLMLLRRRRA